MTRRTASDAALGVGAASLAVAVAAAVLVATIASGSTAFAVAAIAVLGGSAFAAFRRELRQPLLAALFLVAPFDVSKAVVAPVGSVFYGTGPFYSPGLYLTLGDAVLLALAIVWAFQHTVLQRRGLPVTRLDALAAVYVAWIWMRAFGAAQGALSLASAASYTLAVLCFYVVSHNVRGRADLRVALFASAVGLGLELLHVGAQLLTRSPLPLPGSKGLAAGGTVDLGGAQTLRPPGSFSHPNALAHYLVIVLTPLLALALLGPKRLPTRVWATSVALLGAGIAALLTTLSRGGWAAFLIAAAVVVTVYWRHGLVDGRQIWRGLGLVALAGVVVVAVEPTVLLRLTAPDGRSLESRSLLAEAAFAIIRAHPLVGVGFGDYNRAAFGTAAPGWAMVSADYQFALRQLVVHNHFLLIAAELGIPAMLFFVYLLWRFVRLPWPIARWRDPGRFAVAVGLSAGLVGQTFFLNSDNYYADIRIFLLWMAAGVLQAMTLQQREAAATPPEERR